MGTSEYIIVATYEVNNKIKTLRIKKKLGTPLYNFLAQAREMIDSNKYQTVEVMEKVIYYKAFNIPEKPIYQPTLFS